MNEKKAKRKSIHATGQLSKSSWGPKNPSVATDVLNAITQRLENINSGTHETEDTVSDSESISNIDLDKCRLCGKRFDRGDFIISSQCCGSPAHMQCLKQYISSSNDKHCCNCEANYSSDFISMCFKLDSLLPS